MKKPHLFSTRLSDTAFLASLMGIDVPTANQETQNDSFCFVIEPRPELNHPIEYFRADISAQVDPKKPHYQSLNERHNRRDIRGLPRTQRNRV